MKNASFLAASLYHGQRYNFLTPEILLLTLCVSSFYLRHVRQFWLPPRRPRHLLAIGVTTQSGNFLKINQRCLKTTFKRFNPWVQSIYSTQSQKTIQMLINFGKKDIYIFPLEKWRHRSPEGAFIAMPSLLNPDLLWLVENRHLTDESSVIGRKSPPYWRELCDWLKIATFLLKQRQSQIYWNEIEMLLKSWQSISKKKVVFLWKYKANSQKCDISSTFQQGFQW